MAEYAFPGSYLAYPHKGPSTGVIIHEPGMNLRDWFAGQWIAAGNHGNLSPRDMAEQAYDAADAMLEARK